MRILNVAALTCALLTASHSLHAANPSPPTSVAIPAINTVIKTKSGYSIAIDRSTQSDTITVRRTRTAGAIEP
jgi:hypothetical protein